MKTLLNVYQRIKSESFALYKIINCQNNEGKNKQLIKYEKYQ